MACEVTQAVDENLRALQRLLVRVRTGGGVEDEQDPGDRERGGSHPDAVPVNDAIHDAQQSKTSCSSGVLFVKTVRIRDDAAWGTAQPGHRARVSLRRHDGMIMAGGR